MKWSEKEIALLGKDTDRAIAAKIGRSRRAVESFRLLRGIPSHRRHSFKWTARAVALLGTMTDAALAARLGVEYQTVFRKRRKLGIAPSCPFRSPIKE